MGKDKCPECRALLSDPTRCALCDWKSAAMQSQAKRWACEWRTDGRLCNMIGSASIYHRGAQRCSWHDTWESRLERGAANPSEEQQAFEEWLEQYRPGGAYGHDPGQWWAASALLWEALRGLAENPAKTEKIFRELRWRHWAAQNFKDGKPLPKASHERVEGEPLPPWPPAWMREQEAEV